MNYFIINFRKHFFVYGRHNTLRPAWAADVDTDTCKPAMADNNYGQTITKFNAALTLLLAEKDGESVTEKRKTVSEHFDVVNAAVYFSHCPCGKRRGRPSSLVSCRRSCGAHTHTHTLIHTQALFKYLNLINYIYKHAAKAIKFATRTRRMLFALKLSVNQIEAPKVAKWIFMLPHAVALWRRLQEIAIPCREYFIRVLAVGFYIFFDIYLIFFFKTNSFSVTNK